MASARPARTDGGAHDALLAAVGIISPAEADVFAEIRGMRLGRTGPPGLLWRGVIVALRNSRSRKCNVNMARMAAFALVIAFVHLVCSPMNRLRRIEDSH